LTAAKHAKLLTQIQAEAIQLRTAITHLDQQIKTITQHQDHIVRCLNQLNDGTPLTSHDFQRLNLNQPLPSSPLLLKMTLRGRYNTGTQQLSVLRTEQTQKRQALASLSICPLCQGTGWVPGRPEYIRQERRITSQPSLTACAFCSNTGKLQLD
jgi:ABC-type transporter Mla subunit MlaD